MEGYKILYPIPNIIIVNYAGTDVITHVCLKCGCKFIPDNGNKLFCSYCREETLGREKEYLKIENLSPIDYIGNIIGFEIESEISNDRRKYSYNAKKAIYRDLFTCRYCGYSPIMNNNKIISLNADHIQPVSFRGSNNSMKNLVCSCSVCNHIAGGKFFYDFLDKKAFILDKRKSKGLDVEFKDTRKRFLDNIEIVGYTIRRLMPSKLFYEYFLMSDYGDPFITKTNFNVKIQL